MAIHELDAARTSLKTREAFEWYTKAIELRGSVYAEAARDGLTEEALVVLVQAEVSVAQLSIDLGRYEVAEESLQNGEDRLKAALGSLDPEGETLGYCRVYLDTARNQARFQSERYDRMVPVTIGPEWDETWVQQLSYTLRRQLRLASIDAARGDRGGHESLRTRAVEFIETDASTHLHLAMTVAMDLAALDLALKDLKAAEKSVGRVQSSTSELVDSGLLSEEMREMLLISLEASLATLAGAEDLEPLAAKSRAAWTTLSTSWANSPRLEGGIGFLGIPLRRESFFQALSLIRAVDGDAAAFDLLVQTQALGSLDRALSCAAPSLEALSAQLDERDACVVSWVPGATATLACVVDGEGVAWFDCDPIAAVSEELTQLRRGLDPRAREHDSAANARTLDQASRRLGDALLPPQLLERIASHELVALVGTDLLGTRDVEAFSCGDRGPLGMTHAASIAPSIPWLSATLAQEPGAASGRPRVLAVCATDTELKSPLLGTYERLDPGVSLKGLPAHERLTLLAGRKAERDRVLRALDEPHDRFVFLGHGVQDFGRPVPPGLLVADGKDGAAVLWAEQFRDRQLPKECVLLACRVSRGPTRRGDAGATHLAGTFLFAGATATLASSRDLDLELALLLYEEWSQARAAGESAAKALLTARKAAAEATDRPPEAIATALQLHGHGWQ